MATDKGASSDILNLWNSGYMGIVNSKYSGITRDDSGSDYSYSVDANYAKRPVVFVSLGDAKRFCNWLTSQKVNGTFGTETGVYDMSDGGNAVRLSAEWIKAGAVALPDENEWYKAAYYNPAKGGTGGYHTYSFGHANGDTISTNFANYKDGVRAFQIKL